MIIQNVLMHNLLIYGYLIDIKVSPNFHSYTTRDGTNEFQCAFQTSSSQILLS